MNRHFNGVVLFVGALLCALPASAQNLPTVGPDVQALRWWYAQDHPAIRTWMQGAEASAYPAFALIPAFWAGSDVLHGEYQGAGIRLVVAQGAAIATTSVLKRAFRRERPYVDLPDVEARSGGLDVAVRQRDGYAMPSGHATLAFALATSVTLSHPKWHIAAPAYAWAASVSAARVWHGVHYPTDVLAGAATGTLAAWLVHRAWPTHEGERSSVPVGLTMTW